MTDIGTEIERETERKTEKLSSFEHISQKFIKEF